MSLDPGVRLVDDTTGDFIVDLPYAASMLSIGDEIHLTEVGSAIVKYKLEKVIYIAEYVNQATYSVYGQIELRVDVIP